MEFAYFFRKTDDMSSLLVPNTCSGDNCNENFYLGRSSVLRSEFSFYGDASP